MDNLRMSEIRFNTKYHTEESPIKSNINLEYMNDIAKISTYSTDFVNDDYDTITNDTKYLANITKLVTVLYNISKQSNTLTIKNIYDIGFTLGVLSYILPHNYESRITALRDNLCKNNFKELSELIIFIKSEFNIK